MGDSDTETGIAIGSPGVFFDLGGWLSLTVYALTFYTVFFFVIIRVVGNSEKSIWGLVPVGIEALIAGACSPSALFFLTVSFLGMFLAMIAILKAISYVTEALISRPIST